MISCELLAPAGSFEALKAAVLSGANAVYLGGNLFNARASANNFDDQELEEAINYCHLRKVKVFVTVNILVGDVEFKELDKFVRKLNKFGTDGVIIQDIGVAMYIKSIAPNLPLHASTQLTVYDKYGAEFLKNIGFKRIVLARELSKEVIADICKNVDVEIEIFVHGAMCVCYSGQCLMSSMIGGRSGNRGKCAQPCRLNYKAGNKSGYLLSLKDMCLIKHLKDIENIGVKSLKIEGRMKGSEYVGTVVSIYRKYLDNEKQVTDEDYKKLEKIFYRGGFSNGYYTGKKGADMFCHTKPDNPYLKQDEKYEQFDNYKKTDISLEFAGRVNDCIKLIATDEYGNQCDYISTDVIQKARSSSTSADRIKEQLSKLGDTVFKIKDIKIDIDNDAFIPVSEINLARRSIIEMLERKIILSKKRIDNGESYNIESVRENQGFDFSVSVWDKKQLEIARNANCKKIYVPLEIGDFKDDEIVILPRISPKDIDETVKNLPVKNVLVRNIGQFEIAKRYNKDIHIDFTMNVFNKYTYKFFEEYSVKSITLSSELTIRQITDIYGVVPTESIIYGRLPLMVTENCMLKTSSGCTQGGFIEDRTGEKFLIKCLADCRNEIYNSKPIVMSDKLIDIENCGISYGRISFTDESPSECIEILNCYKNKLPITKDFTRGKFYKGV